MSRKGTIGRKEEYTAFGMLALFLFFFLVFKFYPLISTFAISFLDRNSLRNAASTTFVGFSNYRTVFTNEATLQAFGRTFLYSGMYTLFTMSTCLVLAMLLNKEFRGRTVVRTFFYMPYVTNLIAIGVVWNYLLNPYRGPVNRMLLTLGIPEGRLPLWLGSNTSALATAAAIHTWVGLAFPVITLLAALQQIPRPLIEVSELEGATSFQRLRYIIIPFLRPTLIFVLTLTIINSFKTYTVIMALTEGGPGTATQVVSLQIYADAFKYFRLGVASAEGVILTIIIFIISLWVRRGDNDEA